MATTIRTITPTSAAAADGMRMVTLDEPKIELPKQESFTLIERGQSKRTMLRYSLAAAHYAFIAEAKLSSRQLVGSSSAFSAPVAWPAVRDGFAATVGAGGASRSAELTLQALPGEAAAANPEADAYLATWRSLLQGRTAHVAFDERGQFSQIRLDGGDPASVPGQQARDELIQRLLSTIVPLPAEPVGPGASWRAVTILRQRPAYAKQTATYTLTSVSPASWKLHVKLMRVAEQQRIADPSLPPDTAAELLALFRQLEGDIEVDPAHPLIRGGSMTIESRLHVRLQRPDQQAVEQMFEDTGNVALSICQAPPPAATGSGSAAPAVSASRTDSALPPCPPPLQHGP